MATSQLTASSISARSLASFEGLRPSSAMFGSPASVSLVGNRSSRRLVVKAIQPQTRLNVADNSGARELMCIRVLGSGSPRYAHIGDVIVAVVKQAVPNSPIQRSEVVRAVVVRTCKELKRENGMIIRYDDNAAVVIDGEGNPKGTRIFGAIPRELRKLNFTKIVSLAPEVL